MVAWRLEDFSFLMSRIFCKCVLRKLFIITIYYTVTGLTSFTKNPTLNEPKRDRMVANLLLTYHTNTMKINKLFSIKIFMSTSNIPLLTILLFYKKKPFLIIGLFRGLSKPSNIKNWEFCVEKKRGEKKHEWLRSKILPSSNMDTKII